MTAKITDRQQQILDVYRTHYQKYGVSPTQHRIGELLGISAATVNEHVKSLVAAGLLRAEGRRGHVPI